MAEKTIIDISKHNGVIDWAKVKAAGVDGVIIRCGFGTNDQAHDDTMFLTNVKNAKAAGVPFGVYLYSYAKTLTAVDSEAAHVLRLIKGLNLALPVFYDIEEKGTEINANDRANRFIKLMQNAGVPVGIYANEYWFNKYLTKVDGSAWRWVAKYGTNDGKAHEKPAVSNMALWQYTSRGKVDGINGNVDKSILYRDFLIAAEREESKKKSNEEIAAEVIANKWGNGDDRKAALTKAGYNYEEIQKIVNEKLSGKESASKPAAKAEHKTYKIKAGDTLSKIAKAHGTTVKALKELNGIKDANKIKAGDTIKLN